MTTNLAPPDFGPQFPSYPDLDQVLRVSAGALTGTNVYPAFTQQLNPPLSLRDREASYVWEPNGIKLGTGYYDCRLEGVFPVPGHPLYGAIAQLPLYAVTCCVVPGSSSSSGSSSACSLTNQALGAASAPSGSSSITLSNITLAANSLLLVVASNIGAGGTPAVKWGASLTKDATVISSGGSPIPTSLSLFSLYSSSGGTNDLKLTLIGAASGQGMGIQARSVSGLNGVPDQLATNTRISTTPNTGDYSPLSFACEWAEAAFIYGAAGRAWQAPFISGGQDLSISGFTITEGTAALTSESAAGLSSGASVQWCGLARTYS